MPSAITRVTAQFALDARTVLKRGVVRYRQDMDGTWWMFRHGQPEWRAEERTCIGCSGRFVCRPDAPLTQTCGLTCSHQVYPKRPRPRRERYTNDDGYVLVSVPEHPYAQRGGYVLEHRLVVEKRLGRYLHPFEQVHHENGVRDDNLDENLELWTRPHPAGQRATVKHCPSCTCCGDVNLNWDATNGVATLA